MSAAIKHEDLLRRLDVLIGAIYELNEVGCCLHIVLDDGNWKREDVQWCLERAQHGICREVAELLLKLDDKERELRLKSAGFLDFKSDLSTLMAIGK